MFGATGSGARRMSTKVETLRQNGWRAESRSDLIGGAGIRVDNGAHNGFGVPRGSGVDFSDSGGVERLH